MNKKTKETGAKAPSKCAAKSATAKSCADARKPKRVRGKRVTFTVNAKPGSKVYLSGSFNNWSPSAKRMLDKEGKGNYAVTIVLPPGEYHYKFVIDGTWCADPACPEWVQNEHGTLNSVKRVG